MTNMISKTAVNILIYLLLIGATACNDVAVDVKIISSYQGILSWMTPTQYADGTDMPYDQIAGYKIYIQTAPGEYTFAAFISSPAITTSEMTLELRSYNLPAGNYNAAITTIDKANTESALSNEVTIVL